MTNYQVSELVSGLKSRHTDTRHKAIRELLHFAKTDLREMSQESLTQMLDDFNQHIHAMTSSYDNNEKKAGILTIVCLISGETETTKTIRYANYLRNVFPSNDTNILELGAKTMGRMATVLGVKRGEYVENEIKRCYEWLADERNESKRLSAVLILRELAIAMPSYFYQHVNGFFDHIRIAIRDPKEQIREAGAKALRVALVVTSQREQPDQSKRAHWYIQCYEEATLSFTDQAIRERGLSRDDHVHGALLILNELLRCSNAAWEKQYTTLMQKLDADQDSLDEMSSISTKMHYSWSSQHFSEERSNPIIYESAICKKIMEQEYDKISSDVMPQQISRSHHVHQMLLLLIPRLAAFNREVFAKRHLKSTINHLITFLRSREKDKAMAFTTLGLICVAAQSNIQQYLPRIFEIIKLTLPLKDTPKKRNGIEIPLFNCITLLGVAMKETVAPEIKGLLDAMCATGLSQQLTICFKELSHSMPSIKKDITDRLLNILSLILRKKPYVPNNGENHIFYMFTTAMLVEPHDASKLILALRTLGTFDFEWNNTMMSFIRRCTDHYLLTEQHDVRIEAVKTAAKLLIKAIEKCGQTNSRTLNQLIDESLGKLLSVGRSDFDHEVRYRVLEIFMNPIFDRYVAVEDHLDCLFVANNDSNSDVSELALCIVGRLSNLNPSYTTPVLRQLFVQILLELQHSESARNKEQALRMVNNIISHAPTITRQFVDTILKVLVPKLKDKSSNSTMVLTTLKAIGDLAEVNSGGSALHDWLPEVLSIQYDILADPNQFEKRSVALWSFGQVVSATGYVIAPYMDFPNLMDLLLNFLKSEQQPRERRETIRVLGLLGALDPYKYKVNQGLIDFQTVSTLIPSKESADDNFETNISEMLVNMSPLVLDEFYPAIVVTSLMRMLRDPLLAQHHISVVHSVTFIFQSLGIKCVPYISRVTPSLLYVIRTTDNSSFREFLLTQLAKLISVVKIHIRDYLEEIFDMIKEYWTPNSQLQPTLIMLIEHITVAIGTEFKIYLRKILPNILRVLKSDTSKDRYLTEKMLLAIQKFENNLDDVLLSVIPAITGLFDGRNVPLAISKLAMETLEHLSMYLYLKPYSAIIVQSLAKVLDNNPSLRLPAMSTLRAMIVQLGRDYIDYIPSVDKILAKHKIQCPQYTVLVTRLQIISTLASDDDYLKESRSRLRNKKNMVTNPTDLQSIQKLTLNVHNLRKCWSVNNIVYKEDWAEWWRHLSVGFLTESNSPAIRACSTLAQNYPQLASDLFNAAFMSCWTELDDMSRKELVIVLEKALTVPDSLELSLAVLNLAEFMEHCEKGSLPIPIKLLGDTAINCRAYAKALYYKEEEYRRNPSTKVIEALIHINNKLQRKEATNGLIEKVINQKKNGDSALNVHVQWYEQLNNWEQALELYNKKLDVEPQDHESRLGSMRCLEAMGEWRKLYNLATEQWDKMTEDVKVSSAKMATAASWGLQDWDSMKKYVQFVPDNTQEGAFYRAVISIQEGQWGDSRHFIDTARSQLDMELTAVVGESYQRAYGTLVNAQLLTELEEIITYKLVDERRTTIRNTWWTRLQGGQRLVDDWRKILQVRSLVSTPREDVQTWLKFASLCRKTGAVNQAHKIVLSIIGCDPVANQDVLLRVQDPRIVLTYSKNLWDLGNKRHPYEVLQRFVENAEPETEEQCRLLARCHLKLGSWWEALQEINELSIPEILRNYAEATNLAPDWYKACHAWACMNFETVLFYKQQDNMSDSSIAGGSGEKKVSRADFISMHTIPAIEGFFKSISLANGNALQDTLRLLTLWFDHGHHTAIYDALFEGIRQIDIKIWLQVIPQLIARIDSPRSLVAKLVHILLIDIGKLHPQALVYPLTVSAKSSFVTRKNAANYILKTMCTHSQNLVNEAAIISEELIKVAILWHDQVCIALEEASRFFSEKDYKGMFKTLDKIHAMLDRPPETLKEVSFLQMYGRDLKEAQRWCDMYKETNEDRYVNEAWDLYYHVVRRIQAQFRSLTSLELQYVSKRLHSCKDFELAVPGSYVPNQKLIRISHIHSHLQVIKSKQRPRRLTIQGSDGKQYMFLLKGHEDLRQDERVMQLFGLVNTLLQADSNTYRHDLAIQRYAVIPLSQNSGLIGWVPQCDTLYNLISDYRDKKTNKMALNTEQQIMLRMASDYQKLMLKHKVEVFEHALSQTPGNDLARLLWLKSPTAEVWFERRTNYTRSLAVMSMVGYILGLGDRHPSNIMLHRATGKVLHIDFGDCFEVTQTREKFPEKIPFRLTRMLINAMEVTGIEGTYRFICESVMHVLHKHRDSVMAVLEAFVYDPLLNWRLVENDHHSLTESSFSSDIDSSYPLPSRSRNHLRYESLEIPPEANLNKRAIAILNRIRDKLTGRDFPYVESVVSVPKQVDLLIKQATSNENLCQCYIGWCPFW